MIVRAALAGVALLFASMSSAFAQDASVRFMEQSMTDEFVDRVLGAATMALPAARGDDGQPLPPLPEEQRGQPLLDRELVREVIDIGFASGIGEVCELDWSANNFLPLMRRERARGDRSQHQLAAIAIVHGVIQGQVAGAAACGPNGASAATDFYRRKWGEPAAQ